MQTESLNWRWAHGEPIPIERMMHLLSLSKSLFQYLLLSRHYVISVPEMQINTQRYGRRPFGVGLLVAGYDVSMPSFADSSVTEPSLV